MSNQEEIDRILNSSDDLIETVKNTIVGMTNIDPEYHLEMAEFCLQALDAHKARQSDSLIKQNIIKEIEKERYLNPIGMFDKETNDTIDIMLNIVNKAFK